MQTRTTNLSESSSEKQRLPFSDGESKDKSSSEVIPDTNKEALADASTPPAPTPPKPTVKSENENPPSEEKKYEKTCTSSTVVKHKDIFDGVATPTFPPHIRGMVNFETLAHNVIKEELLRVTPPHEKVKPDTSDVNLPQDLSINRKEEQCEIKRSSKSCSKPYSKTLQNRTKPMKEPEIVDLTETNSDPETTVASKSPATAINNFTNHIHHRQAYSNSTMKEALPAFITTTTFSNRVDNALTVPSRTHCPRMADRPPPFVPTKAKRPAVIEHETVDLTAIPKMEAPSHGRDFRPTLIPSHTDYRHSSNRHSVANHQVTFCF